MRRVLFASWYSGLGGGETDLLMVADGLASAGYECHLLVPRAGKLAERWRAMGMPCHRLAYRGATTAFLPSIWARFPVVRRMRALLQREGIALVHSDYHTLPLLCPAARRTNIPITWTVWGWWFKPRPWQRRFFHGIPALARSCAIRDGFLGEPPFMPAQRLPVIYAGVDTQRFQPGGAGLRLRQELGIDSAAALVAMVARFQRVKGHHIFQAMARRVLAQLPDVHFLVAGDDVFGVVADQRYRNKILARAREDSLLRDRLHYIGFRQDVERVYAAADIVVCPSLFESYGKANLEAMSCGKPIVSSRRGGPSETVLHGETGFLVDSGDVGAFAAHVLRLLGDEALQQRMGAAARAHVLANFSSEMSILAQRQFYEQLLN